MKLLKALLLSILFLSLPQLIKRDFKVPPSHKEISFNPAWEISAPESHILSILNQPFTYLAHGNQSTVFASQDNQYVLKLFRYTRPRFPLVHDFKCWMARIAKKKPKDDLLTKVSKTFTAAQIACTEAQKYTQVIFCHLNLTENQLPTAEIHADRTYHLPLDRTRFVLQRKAMPFKETLLSARNDPATMHRLIDSLINLLRDRSALGIRNSDPNLGPNFGFLNGQAVEIDFGNYRKAPQTSAEINSYLSRLEHWLKKNAPEYVDYLKDLRIKTPISYDPERHETAEKLHRSQRTLH